MKLRVAVLYGGKSGEHEVSLQSASSVIRNLDPERFEVIPVAIDKRGRWLLNDLTLIHEAQKAGKALPVFAGAPEVVLPPASSGGDGKKEGSGGALITVGGGKPPTAVDVVFPVMHGTYCEDGSIQGLLELADVAYVGSGVLASAVGMDKEIAKRLVQAAGVPVVPGIAVRFLPSGMAAEALAARVVAELGYPVFVKPANLGSSVGVSKVKEASALRSALELAFKYDSKVLVEKAVDAREIELSVLEGVPLGTGAEPRVSVPGEIAPTHEFYSYDAKYLDDKGAELMIPAKLSPEQVARAQAIARKAFVALECEGMARVDLFLDRKGGEFYFNEVNTIPGFTSISMYPKMWEASGLPYRELLSALIDLAVERQKRKRALVRDYLQK